MTDIREPKSFARLMRGAGRRFITIRQRFVMAAMQGLLASCADQVSDPTTLGVDAVRCADFALAEEARTRSKA